VDAPSAFTPAQVLQGAALYDRNCVSCHGAPGVARADWTNGMTPSPPYLIDAPRRWSRPELYWIVSNGVKMTAMPAWSETLSHAQLWDVVAFLEAQPYLSSQDYARMKCFRRPAQTWPPAHTCRAPLVRDRD